MSINFCDFNDPVLGTFKYQKSTTLFKLDKLPLKKLLKDFRAVSHNVEFLEASIVAIKKILSVIQEDTKYYQAKDVQVTIGLELTKKNEIIIRVSSDAIIFPFDMNEKSVYITIPLHELNVLTTYTLAEHSPLTSKIDNELFRTLKKIDSFLDYNNELYQLIVSNGVYPRLIRPKMELFKLEYNENVFRFESNLNGYFESDYKLPFFKFSVDDRRVNILLAGQLVCLTVYEFLETPNQSIIDIIVSLLKIKNLSIDSISNLKDYLLIQDMKNI